MNNTENTMDVFANVNELVNGVAADKSDSITKSDNTIIERQTFKFMNSNGKSTLIQSTNKDFNDSVIKIRKAQVIGRTMNIIVSKELAKISENAKLIESFGFKDIGSLAYSLFDIKPVTARQYARIGKLFVNDNYTLVDYLPSEFTATHCLELLTLCKDDNIDVVKDLIADGDITSGMSASKVRQVVKEYNGNKKQDENTIDGTATVLGENASEANISSSTNDSETTTTTTTTNSSSIAKEVEFTKELAVAEILDSVDRITSRINQLNEHEYKISSFTKELEKIKATVNALLNS